jgi:hypothetical protein
VTCQLGGHSVIVAHNWRAVYSRCGAHYFGMPRVAAVPSLDCSFATRFMNGDAH